MAIRIGIAGSSFRLKSKEIEVARKLGRLIGNNNLLIFICYDKISLPLEVARQTLKNGSEVICFVSNKKEEKGAKKIGFFTINLNLPRLFREIIFINNIDILIVCGGGSGTLMEVTFAYQLDKPIFILKEIKGSVSIFENKYLDEREKINIKSRGLKELQKELLWMSKK